LATAKSELQRLKPIHFLELMSRLKPRPTKIYKVWQRAFHLVMNRSFRAMKWLKSVESLRSPLSVVGNWSNCRLRLAGGGDALSQLLAELICDVFVLRAPDQIECLGRIARD
jgi:hypothetical protein